jgi:signal transduction histidine kinase
MGADPAFSGTADNRESLSPDQPSGATAQRLGLFDSVFHEVDEAIAIIRADDPEAPRIVDVNQRFEDATGFDRATVQNSCLFDLIGGTGPNDRTPVCDIISEAIRTRTTICAGITIMGRNHSLIPLEVKIRPCETADDDAKFVCFLRGQQDAEEERRAAEQITNRLLTFLSHDLRTPLNGILGFSEIMMNGVLGPLDKDAYEAYARDIHTAGQDLLRLVNGLLDLSHSESAPLKLYDHPFPVENWIRAAVSAMAAKAAASGIDLVSDIEEGLPVLKGDEARLRQALLILLANAIKFTDKGGRITLSARTRAQGLEVRVTDTGVGIAENELRTAFLPYRRIEDVYSNPKAGIGVGLPLVKVLIEQHGGSVAIESAQGIGTTVILRLPPERLG